MRWISVQRLHVWPRSGYCLQAISALGTVPVYLGTVPTRAQPPLLAIPRSYCRHSSTFALSKRLDRIAVGLEPDIQASNLDLDAAAGRRATLAAASSVLSGCAGRIRDGGDESFVERYDWLRREGGGKTVQKTIKTALLSSAATLRNCSLRLLFRSKCRIMGTFPAIKCP